MSGRRLGLLVAIVPVYVLLAWVSPELGEFDALSVWYAPAGLALAAYILIGPRLPVARARGVHRRHRRLSRQHPVLRPADGRQCVRIRSDVRACRSVASPPRIDRAGGHHSRRAPLIASGIVVAPGCAALFGVGMQQWAGFVQSSGYWRSVSIWWVGDAIGIATLTPALLVLGLVTGFGAPRLLPPALRTAPGHRFVAAELILPAVVAALVFLVSSETPVSSGWSSRRSR